MSTTNREQGFRDEALMTLAYMSRADQPLFPMVLERGVDPELNALLKAGYIEVVHRHFRIGRAEYSAGYVITEAGRRALRTDKQP